MSGKEFLFSDEQSFFDIFNKYLSSEKQSKLISELKKLEGNKKKIASNAVNSEGISAFDVAVCDGKLLVADYLYKLSVQEGSNVIDHIDNYGKASIHKAIAKGNIEVVKFLIERDCNLKLSTEIAVDKSYYDQRQKTHSYRDVREFLGCNHDNMNVTEYWSAIDWVSRQSEIVVSLVLESERSRVGSDYVSEAHSGKRSRISSFQEEGESSFRSLNLRKNPEHKKEEGYESGLFSNISQNSNSNTVASSYVEVKESGRCNIL